MTGTLFTPAFTVAAPCWALMILLGSLGLAGIRTRWVRSATFPAPRAAAASATAPQRLG